MDRCTHTEIELIISIITYVYARTDQSRDDHRAQCVCMKRDAYRFPAAVVNRSDLWNHADGERAGGRGGRAAQVERRCGRHFHNHCMCVTYTHIYANIAGIPRIKHSGSGCVFTQERGGSCPLSLLRKLSWQRACAARISICGSKESSARQARH